MAFSISGGPLRSEMNVTPMIDVLLVLIVVFMIVVSTSTETGLKAQIPQPAPDRPRKSEDPIVIQVEAGLDRQVPLLKINNEVVDWANLHDRLLEIFKLRAQRIAFVKGGDNIEFQNVADAISIARSSGVDRIGLMTER